MNIKKMNLNLLIALDALLTEKNVTRAGQKIFITQSAMSNVLKQLREIFNDDLLIMQGRSMQLTLRAQKLHPEIKQLLSQAEHIFETKKFDPKTSNRKFVIGMEEYTNFILLPDLYTYFNQHAPHVSLEVSHVPFFSDKAMLESQSIELAIGLLPAQDDAGSIFHEPLFKEHLVCIASKKNILFKQRLTLKKYLEASHVSLFTNQSSSSLIIDQTLANMGYQRCINLKLAHIVPGLYTITRSNLIATVPEGVAREASRLFNLAIQPCPLPLPAISFSQSWHPRAHSDSGNQWLRNVIKEIVKNKG